MTSFGRASLLIGAGTVISRLSGFVRSIVLVAALGSVGSRAADAFSTANQLPNNIYAIISTGIITAVVVPQIVKAASHADGGRAFVSKLFTLGTTVLLGATALAMVFAPLLVVAYAPNYTPDQMALATAFAYWCLPQVLFYGLYALLGETLNARNAYGPFTWAPIINNVVSVAGFGAFIALFGPQTEVTGWTPGMVTVIGATATGGVVAQAIVLLLFWRGAGLSLRPDFRWRGVGLRHIGRLAGWTFLMVLVGQAAGLIQSQLLSAASGYGPAATTSQNMWLLFMLPYSVIVVSIGTPYFTRLSEQAHAGNVDAVRTDVGRSITMLGLFIVLATAALAAAAIPAARIFTDSDADAPAAALMLLCYLAGLIPMSVLYIVQRSFYAFDDTRTPFLFTLLQAVLVVLTAFIASWTLPREYLGAGIALGQSFAMLVQVIAGGILLRRKIGDLRARVWLGSLARFGIAAIPAGLAGYGVFLLAGGVHGWMVSGQILGAVGTAVVGLSATVVYVLALAVLRAPELGPGIALVRRIVRR